MQTTRPSHTPAPGPGPGSLPGPAAEDASGVRPAASVDGIDMPASRSMSKTQTPRLPQPPAVVARFGTPQQWADGLWYLGHVMGAGSLISRYSLPAAAVLVGLGQLLVIVSRPLGRVQMRPRVRPADDSV